MEVESQRGEFSLIIFDDTLQDADVEWNMSPVDRQQNGVVLVVNVN